MKMKQRGRPRGTGLNGRTRYLTDQELQTLMKIAKRKGRKYDLILSLALFFGLRSREVAELKIADFDFKTHQVKIRGLKGGLTRVYENVPDQIWHKLRQYLKNRREPFRNEYLFPHRFYETRPMSASGAQALFKYLCREAGIEGHSIHDLRHTTGRLLALQNFSPFRIARHLRQKSPASSTRYVDLADDLEAEEQIKGHFGEFL
jgi:integrase